MLILKGRFEFLLLYSVLYYCNEDNKKSAKQYRTLF